MDIDLERHDPAGANPLDLMEELASANAWPFDRSGVQHLSLEAAGHWCDYRISLTWHPEVGTLIYVCVYELRVPQPSRARVAELIAMVNKRVMVGHFDSWADGGRVVHRHALLLRGLTSASVEQLEDLVDTSLEECERFFPAFQFVIWGGKKPAEAVAAAVLETRGEA